MTTNVSSVKPLVRRGCRRGFALAAIAPLLAALLPAQTSPANTGAIVGTISNVATGQNLEGAEVMLSPGNVTVLANREGRFLLPPVAPGLYTLTATYSGLDPKSVEVRVTPGITSTYEVGLSSQAYQLSKFVVEGEREGNALAITQRRNAGNVKDVVSSDAVPRHRDPQLHGRG